MPSFRQLPPSLRPNVRTKSARPDAASIHVPVARAMVDCAVYCEGTRLPGKYTHAAALNKVHELEAAGKQAFAWIGLHEDHTCAAQRGNSLELRDQCGGNTLSPVRSSHCQVVDVDLASFLLELGQHVGRESPDNFFVFQGSDRDEGIAAKQPLQISLAGLGATVGVRLLKRLAEQAQHGPHQSSVSGTETSNGARDNGWQIRTSLGSQARVNFAGEARRRSGFALNEMLGLRGSAGIGSSSC